MSTKFTVLLVDDDGHVADILNRAAQHTFPEAVFVHASTYENAVAYIGDLTGRGPHLILLDINLQIGLSGFDFLSLVRQHPQGQLLPIIILSASQQEADKREAYRLGATVYTSKPFTFPAWKAYVANLRSYWYETATIPKVWFGDESTG